MGAARSVGRSAAPAAAAWLERELSPAALGALAPAAPGVPGELWSRSLRDVVLEMAGRPGKEFRARLTGLAYRLSGGQGDAPAALAAMLEVIHAGSMIVDDIEDGSLTRRDRPALHQQFGVPLALNAGNWMYFLPLDAAGRLGLAPAGELALRRLMTRVMLDCHYGQALDLGARIGEVPQAQIADVALTVSTLKTGRLMGLAAAAGAIVAGAKPAMGQALAAFGEALGIGLQMLDDLGNLSASTSPDRRHEDLRQGRVTWPWAWAAALLDPPEFRRLEGQGRAAAAGDAAPAPLAAALRRTAAAHGRLQAHWHLEQALAGLRQTVGRSPLLPALEAELARLEVSYGG
jgi:geranylgeranyl pyrophosphate synthase